MKPQYGKNEQGRKKNDEAAAADGQPRLPDDARTGTLYGPLLSGRDYRSRSRLGRCHQRAVGLALRLFLGKRHQERAAHTGRHQQRPARRAAGHDTLLRGRHHRHFPPLQHEKHGDGPGLCRWRREHYQGGEQKGYAVGRRPHCAVAAHRPHDLAAHLLWQLPASAGNCPLLSAAREKRSTSKETLTEVVFYSLVQLIWRVFVFKTTAYI